MERTCFFTFLKELSSWGRTSIENMSAFDMHEQIINLEVLTELLVQQSNSY